MCQWCSASTYVCTRTHSGAESCSVSCTKVRHSRQESVLLTRKRAPEQLLVYPVQEMMRRCCIAVCGRRHAESATAVHIYPLRVRALACACVCRVKGREARCVSRQVETDALLWNEHLLLVGIFLSDISTLPLSASLFVFARQPPLLSLPFRLGMPSLCLLVSTNLWLASCGGRRSTYILKVASSKINNPAQMQLFLFFCICICRIQNLNFLCSFNSSTVWLVKFNFKYIKSLMGELRTFSSSIFVFLSSAMEALHDSQFMIILVYLILSFEAAPQFISIETTLPLSLLSDWLVLEKGFRGWDLWDYHIRDILSSWRHTEPKTEKTPFVHFWLTGNSFTYTIL